MNPLDKQRARLKQEHEAIKRGLPASALRSAEIIARARADSEAHPVAPASGAVVGPPEVEAASATADVGSGAPGAVQSGTGSSYDVVDTPSVADAPEVLYRLMLPSDLGFCASTWVFSSQENVPIYSKMGQATQSDLTWLSNRLLRTWGARIACDPQDPDAIWAWACVARKLGHRPRILHVFVRGALRGHGYAKGLLADLLDQDAILGALPYEKGRAPLPSRWKYKYISGTMWALTESPNT